MMIYVGMLSFSLWYSFHFVKISQNVCSSFVIGHFHHFHWKDTDSEHLLSMSFCGYVTGFLWSVEVRGQIGWAPWCGSPYLMLQWPNSPPGNCVKLCVCHQ